MSKGQNNGGLMSSVGLTRYFDAEGHSAIQVDPETVFAAGALFGIGVLVLDSLTF